MTWPGIVCEWLNEPNKCSVHSLSRCSRACIAQYMPKGLYQPVHSHEVVLADTSPRACIVENVSSLRKTESVLENTIGKLKGTWRVKIKYITFKNWIMYHTVLYHTVLYSEVILTNIKCVLYFTVLHHAVLQYTVRYCTHFSICMNSAVLYRNSLSNA